VATTTLSGSSAAGSNVLASRTGRVKTALKLMQKSYEDVVKEDEDGADLFLEEMMNSSEQADTALDTAAAWADSWDLEKETRKEKVAARPRLSFQQYNGESGDWLRFTRDARQIMSLYPGDQPQALNVLLQFCSEKVKILIKKFSGRECAIEEAIASLNVQFGIAHLSVPGVVLQIEQVKPAVSLNQVPAVCTRILNLLEILGGMMQKEDSLDASLVHGVYRKLYLSPGELRDIVPTLKSEKISLTYMTEFVKERFMTFELLRRTVLRDQPPATQGAMGQAGLLPTDRPKEEKKKWKKPEGSEKKEGGKRTFPDCCLCESKKLEAKHHLVKCPRVGPAQRVAVAKLGRCTDCLRPINEGHRCSRTDKGGQVKQVYCVLCKSNILFCTEPGNHAKSPLPETVQGHLCFSSPPPGEPLPPSLGLASTLHKVKQHGMEMLEIYEASSPGAVNKGSLGRGVT
jgi:hypothetical protein